MATIGVRWPGYFDDFGKAAAESTIQGAVAGTQVEFLGVIVRFVVVGGMCQAHLSLSPDRVQMQKLVGELDFTRV